MHIRDRIIRFDRVAANTLRPHPRNWRTHPTAQLDALRGILAEVGFAGAELVRQCEDGSLMLIDGHARAEIMGAGLIPVLVLDVDENEAAKLLATFDPIGAMAGANSASLDKLLTEVSMESEALSNMLRDLAIDHGILDCVDVQVIEDEIPEPLGEAVTRPGDLWILGNHRLLCGDSSKPEDLDRLLDGQPIHLANTDPPYNVKVEPRSNNAIAAGLSSFKGATHHQSMDVARHPEKSKPTHKKMRAKDRPLENDFLSDAEFDRMLDAWFGNIARVLVPGRCFYIWGGYANCANYPPFLKKHNLYFSQAIIWDKQHPVLTRKDFMGAHEWCFYGWREGAAHKFFGPNNATDLWQVKKVNPQAMVHLTEKPVELAARAIQYSTKRNENVLDLFGGSGSTLVAAEQTNRRAFLIELDAQYCDVIIRRWEKLTGLQAELQSREVADVAV